MQNSFKLQALQQGLVLKNPVGMSCSAHMPQEGCIISTFHKRPQWPCLANLLSSTGAEALDLGLVGI